MKIDWRFIFQAELSRNVDRFDVRVEGKGGTRIILRFVFKQYAWKGAIK